MIADHRRNLGRVGKIETLPILQICPRPSQTIGDISDLQFSLVGKIWDSLEAVKSPIVWDFPDIWKPGFTNPLNCWAQVPLSQKNMASLENLEQTSGDYPIYRQNLGWSAKSKIPDRLGFFRPMKTRLSGFHRWKKSQTIGDFAFCRPSQILPIYRIIARSLSQILERRHESYPMVGHLFQNYDTICVRFFPTYTCNHSCYTIYVRFFVTYTCVLFPSIWPFSYKRAYICAQKSQYICVANKHVVYVVTEGRRIRGTELCRQQKTPSCTKELKSNFSLNQAWPQWPR